MTLVLWLSRQYRAALDTFLELVELFPSWTLAHYKAGLAMLALGGPEAVVRAKNPFRCAVRLEPENIVLRGNVDMTLRLITCVQCLLHHVSCVLVTNVVCHSGMPTVDKYWTVGER